MTLDKQIDLFKSTTNNDMLRENLEMHLSKSIFFISIGPNDYFLNYFKNSSDISKLFSPDEFAKFLINELAKRLQVFSFSVTLLNAALSMDHLE